MNASLTTSSPMGVGTRQEKCFCIILLPLLPSKRILWPGCSKKREIFLIFTNRILCREQLHLAEASLFEGNPTAVWYWGPLNLVYVVVKLKVFGLVQRSFEIVFLLLSFFFCIYMKENIKMCFESNWTKIYCGGGHVQNRGEPNSLQYEYNGMSNYVLNIMECQIMFSGRI